MALGVPNPSSAEKSPFAEGLCLGMGRVLCATFGGAASTPRSRRRSTRSATGIGRAERGLERVSGMLGFGAGGSAASSMASSL